MSVNSGVQRLEPLPPGTTPEAVAMVRREQAQRAADEVREPVDGGRPERGRRGSESRDRSRVHQLERELAESRARLAELESGVDAAAGETPAGPDVVGGAAPEDGAAEPAAELAAERDARQAAELELEAERAAYRAAAGLPAGAAIPTIPAETTRAMRLVDACRSGASPAGSGLDHLNARLRDPSVDWPTLRRELLAHGFQEPGI